MKQNICELDTMIFFREALEAHEFMLLPVMASAVVECRTADKELKTLNEDGEIGLARLFSIWANMMCAPGAATIVGCRPNIVYLNALGISYKLVGMKGNSLRIEPKEAKVVRMIFDMYGKQGIGYNTIAHELNQMNIPSLTGTWGQTSITNILNNEVYLGMIRWKHEPTKRVVKDGMLTKKRVTSKDYELYEGLHEPIIDQEQWDRVKAVQSSRNHASVHKDKKLMNPFATILFCEKCGAVMKRNVPAKTQNTSPWYRCPTRGCNCRTIKCDFLEAEVVKAMSQWWGEYTIKIKEDKVAQTDSTETALSIVREQLTELQLQQDKICEYLEKGIYTIEMFTKRNDTLTREIHKVQAAENELLKKQGAQKDIHDVEKEIIPTTQHILDSYPQLSVEEKNRLWKIVMERITAYRTPGGEVSIHIYPKLPMR